jgi:hypothetical protein
VLCTRGDPDHPLHALNDAWMAIHYPPESTSLELITRVLVMAASHRGGGGDAAAAAAPTALQSSPQCADGWYARGMLGGISAGHRSITPHQFVRLYSPLPVVKGG